MVKPLTLAERVEGLVAEGKVKEAVALLVADANEVQASGKHLAALMKWEAIARAHGPSGAVMAGIAHCCEQLDIWEEALDFWIAAATRLHAEGAWSGAHAARDKALALKKLGIARAGEARPRARLAMDVIGEGSDFVRDLL